MTVMRRLGSGVVTVVVLVTSIFFLIRVVPGDPARLMAGVDATPEQVRQLREQLGLNDPLWKQYADMWSGIASGDLGTSITTRVPVSNEILSRLWDTVVLAVSGMALAIVLSVMAGLVAAKYHGRVPDLVVSSWAISAASIPYFWFALLLVDWFAVRNRWFPSGGAGSVKHLVLPAVVIATTQIGLITRVVRSSVLDVLNADYIRTARSKGVSERAVLTRHALRNALVPVITVIGLNAGLLIGGAVVVETVFNWPGVARLLVHSVSHRDYPVIQGLVLLFGITFILVNLAVDLINMFVDPRMRRA